ncbi:MAG: PD-(D/E)XK nuclease family protein, partial [Halarsenatibacteraceae bacterium]
MEFRYLDFNQDLFEKAVTEEPALYILPNSGDIKAARSTYNRELLTAESKFLDWNSFKELIFPVDDLILKEEKLSIGLFSLMTSADKKFLNISEYGDVLEFSGLFHNYYLERSEYLVDSLPVLAGWQKERLDLIEKLRSRYLNWLSENNYTDKSLVYDLENYNPARIKAFERIVVINPVETPPLEREIIHKLAEEFTVEIFLQLESSNYSEEKLRLENFKLPDEPAVDLKLYTAEEDIGQLASALKLAVKNQAEIITPNLEKRNYSKLLSEKEVDLQASISLEESSLYRLLKCCYNLLLNYEPKKTGLGLLPVNQLLNAINQPVVVRYFELEIREVKEEFNQLISQGYYYLNGRIIAENLPALKPLFSMIDDLSGMETLTEVINYLDKLELDKLADPLFQDEIDQFYDGLIELTAIEKLGLVENWRRFFSRPAQGLLELILNYLKYKKIATTINVEQERLLVQDFQLAPARRRENLIILNASQGELPVGGSRSFLLNPEQRVELGLPTAREEQKWQRYYFFRHILTADRAEIFGLNNQDENLSPGSLMEELKFKYRLEYQESPVKRSDYLSFLNNIFASQAGYNFGQVDREEYRRDLKQNLVEETGGRTSLTYYKYNRIKDCYHRYYLEHIIGLEPGLELADKAMNPMVFGIMVHNLMDRVITELKPELTANTLDIEPYRARVEEIVDEIIGKYYLFYDQRFKGYYKEIIKPRLVDSIFSFIEGLARRLPASSEGELTDWDWKLEYTPPKRVESFYQEAGMEFYLRGRIDLLIETGREEILVDFKTGSGSVDQLD